MSIISVVPFKRVDQISSTLVLQNGVVVSLKEREQRTQWYIYGSESLECIKTVFDGYFFFNCTVVL